MNHNFEREMWGGFMVPYPELRKEWEELITLYMHVDAKTRRHLIEVLRAEVKAFDEREHKKQDAASEELRRGK